MRLDPTVYMDCVGCPHYFVQLDARRAECTRCRLGVFGRVIDGKLT